MSAPRTQALISGFLDRHATTRDIAELDGLLQSSPEAVAQLVALAQIDQALKRHHRDRHAKSAAAQLLDRIERDEGAAVQNAVTRSSAPPAGEASTPSASVRSPVLGFLSGVWEAVQASPRAFVAIIGLALGGYFLVLFALIPLARLSDSTRQAQMSRVGQMTSSPEARWFEPPPHDGQVSIGRRYELAHGRISLSLRGGTQIAIEGPARWQFDSESHVQFDRGQLAAFVPPQAVGFTVATPLVGVVDLGTEFDLNVAPNGETEVYVRTGKVALQSPARAGPSVQPRHLSAGSAVRVAAGPAIEAIPFGPGRTSSVRTVLTTALQKTEFDAPAFMAGQPIWLSNLFDDRPHVPLAEAMRTDTFRAAADFNDLGVARVAGGTSSIQEVSPGLRFDLTNLGWDEGVWPTVGVFNDAWTNHELFRQGGIRLEGKAMHYDAPRTEEGIGMQASALVTFDLEDIRDAGRLTGRGFEFVCDRAGINDGALGLGGAVHLAVIVSNGTGIEAAWLDGAPAEVVQERGLWSFANPGAPISAGFVSFRVPAPASAKHLTLVSASAGDSTRDQTAWINARLECVP